MGESVKRTTRKQRFLLAGAVARQRGNTLLPKSVMLENLADGGTARRGDRKRGGGGSWIDCLIEDCEAFGAVASACDNSEVFEVETSDWAVASRTASKSVVRGGEWRRGEDRPRKLGGLLTSRRPTRATQERGSRVARRRSSKPQTTEQTADVQVWKHVAGGIRHIADWRARTGRFVVYGACQLKWNDSGDRCWYGGSGGVGRRPGLRPSPIALAIYMATAFYFPFSMLFPPALHYMYSVLCFNLFWVITGNICVGHSNWLPCLSDCHLDSYEYNYYRIHFCWIGRWNFGGNRAYQAALRELQLANTMPLLGAGVATLSAAAATEGIQVTRRSTGRHRRGVFDVTAVQEEILMFLVGR